MAVNPRSLSGRTLTEPREQAEQRKAYDRRRDAAPWRGWYKLARWLAIRRHQLQQHPLCVMCDAEGRIEPATVCDHVTPHRGDAALFWRGPFQSLCAWHHNRTKQAEEAAHRRG